MIEGFSGPDEGEDFAYYSKLIDRQRRTMDTVQLEPRTGYPQVDVHIVYGPHASAAHIEPIRGDLAQADVYIPELSGWDKKTLKQYQAVAAGTISAEKAIPTAKHAVNRLGIPDETAAFKAAQLRVIAGTGIPITFIDVPEGHPGHFQRVGEERGIAFQETFAATLAEVKDVVDEEAWMKRNREHLMLNNLEPQLAALMKQFSDLKAQAEKGALKILMTIGSQHTTLGKILDQQQQELHQPSVTSRELETVSYGPMEEAVAQAEAGHPITDDLAAKVLLYEVMTRGSVKAHLMQYTDDAYLVETVCNYLIDQFTTGEIEALYERAHRNPVMMGALLVEGYDEKAGPEAQTAPPGVIEEKGFKLPTSEKEIQAMAQLQTAGK